MEKKISVIIAAYNVEEYLMKCLETVKNQTYKNLQIIVIDDGSTDSTPQICDSYKADNRFVIVHKKNGGLSAARNTGLDIADGDYLIFIDGDDYIEENLCEELVEKSEKNNSDMVIFSYFRDYGDRVVQYHNDGKLKMISQKEAIKGLVNDERIKSMVWMKFYKRELFKDLYFKERHNYEDVYIMHHIFFRAKIIMLYNKSLYYYRYREDSISNFQSEKNLNHRWESLLLRYKDISETYPELEGDVLKKTAYAYADIYNSLCAAKHPDKKNIKRKINIFYKDNSKKICLKTKVIFDIVKLAKIFKMNMTLYMIMKKINNR